MNQIFTGAIPSTKDQRDYLYDDLGMSSTPFDWVEGYDVEEKVGHKLKVKDQNGSFSCGGQAYAYYAEILDVVHDKEKNEKSARYIYAPIAYRGGGSTARDLSDRLIKFGSANETIVPSYDNGEPPTEEFMTNISDITAEVDEQAKTDRASSYVALASRDISSIAQMIRDNYGCVVGISGANNGTWTSEFPNTSSVTAWNHFLYVGKAISVSRVEYDGLKKGIITMQDIKNKYKL